MAKKTTHSNTNNNSNKKKKRSKKAGPNTISMKLKSKPQPPKDNPFETIWSRRKFDILGKKRTGEHLRVGHARTRALDKRKKTLLKEYEQSGKASSFVDRRIGEENDALGEFDKAILRSQRERQTKIKKGGKYNLSDGEEDEFEKYGGQWDDFDEQVEHGSDVDDYDVFDQERSTILKQLNTLDAQKSMDEGFAEEEESRPKSKKEVMEEVILKSKFFKAQKAKEKEENEKIVEQLDKEFESLVQSEAFSSLTQPSKMNALKSLVNPNFSRELKKSGTSVSENSKLDEPDVYDKLVNEMTLEMRARPSDRTKTAEEIAEEEKERLEQLEQERQNRMLATDDASDEDENSEEGHNQSARTSSHVSGDDLGDSFTVDEKPQKKKGWVDEILERDDEEDSENEDSESSDGSEDDEDEDEGETEDEGGETEEGNENDEKPETLKDWEQSDDDGGAYSEEDEADGGEGKDQIQHTLENKMNKKAVQGVDKKKASLDSKNAGGLKQPSSVMQDLPFKIDAPSNIDDLQTLFRGHSNEDIIEAIRRIRVCNAIALAAENRKKMQVFYGLLLQYFATLANQKPLNFQLLNLLVKPLMEMSAEIPYFSAICARERLLRTRTKFCEDIKDPEKSCWPSLKTLFVLRLWSMIFPCSDFRHAVMTPAILLMCEYLMRCPVQSMRDAAIGSFLCSMILLVTKQSQKFCPEALMFLKALLVAAVDKDSRSCQGSENIDQLLEFKAPIRLCFQAYMVDIKPLDFVKIMNLPEDSSSLDTDGFRGSILLSVVETLRGFVNIYKEIKAFPEIFSPFSALLIELGKQKNMPGPLQEKLKDVVELIRAKVEEHHKLRQPLQMRKQKPVPIKLLNPKFEENFVKGRDYDPDRARAELKKLKKMHRNEAKGAARELRKDNYFLRDVKEKEKLRLEQERQENYGKVRAFLQEQEHAYKSGQLGKTRKRSR